MAKVFGLSLIFIILVASAAYFLGTYVSGPKVYPDLLPTNQPTNQRSNQVAEQVNNQATNQDQNITQSVEDINDEVPLSNIPVEANLEPNQTEYKSKLNKRVSFMIREGSKVEEVGDVTNIKFTITAPNTKKYFMTFNKASSGCFDPLGSFSIQSGQGVDFRIIQDKKEYIQQDSLSAMHLFEMYGSYSGAVGFRANACIYTAVPTKIEIRTNGFGRYEGADAYKELERILKSLKV